MKIFEAFSNNWFYPAGFPKVMEDNVRKKSEVPVPVVFAVVENWGENHLSSDGFSAQTMATSSS